MGNRLYAVELLRRVKGKDEPLPVGIVDLNGQAFASIKIEDTYEVALYNYDNKCQAIAKVNIDFLDANATFNEDTVKCEGYAVNQTDMTAHNPSIVPGWLRSAKESKNNVFKFLVNKLGDGVATQRGVRSNIGTVTVSFFEASESKDGLRGRSFGETGKGEPFDVNYQVKPLYRNDQPVSIVTIRYTRSPK